MKKAILVLALSLSGFVFNITQAQVSVSVNIGLQPIWGPVGYDHVDYYYLPDIDAYYDVPAHMFIYYQRGAWIRTAGLPPQFAHYDLYHGYKVVINERDPWLRHDVYKAKYAGYRNRRDQMVIRDSHEPKYWVIKDHPEHGKWRGEEHHEDHREEHH